MIEHARFLNPNEPIDAAMRLTVPAVAWLLRRRTSAIREMLKDGRLDRAPSKPPKVFITVASVERLIGKRVTVYEFMRSMFPASRRYPPNPVNLRARIVVSDTLEAIGNGHGLYRNPR